MREKETGSSGMPCLAIYLSLHHQYYYPPVSPAVLKNACRLRTYMATVAYEYNTAAAAHRETRTPCLKHRPRLASMTASRLSTSITASSKHHGLLTVLQGLRASEPVRHQQVRLSPTTSNDVSTSHSGFSSIELRGHAQNSPTANSGARSSSVIESVPVWGFKSRVNWGSKT